MRKFPFLFFVDIFPVKSKVIRMNVKKQFFVGRAIKIFRADYADIFQKT